MAGVDQSQNHCEIFPDVRKINSVDGLEDSLFRVEILVPMNTDNEKDDNNDDNPFQDVDEINSFTEEDN